MGYLLSGYGKMNLKQFQWSPLLLRGLWCVHPDVDRRPFYRLLSTVVSDKYVIHVLDDAIPLTGSST